MTNYYRLLADPAAVTRWHISAPFDSANREVDPRAFTCGSPYTGDLQLAAPLRRAGQAVDFNLGDFDMVVTPDHLNVAIQTQTRARTQRIPIRIGEAGLIGFEILNILDVISCFDEARSEFAKWTWADGRPDKVGKLRMVTSLRIDPSKTSGSDLFRLAEWPIALIASETTKNLFERVSVTGAAFEPVCDFS